MAGKKDILPIVRSFSVRKKSHILPMAELLRYAEKCIEQKSQKEPSLSDLATDTALKITTLLEELGEDESCKLNYVDGKIETVEFPEFFLALVRKRYTELDNDPDLPFPSEPTFGVAIPKEIVTSVDVKSEFVAVLEEHRFEQVRLIRLVFPEGINSAIVPSDLIDKSLMKLCLQRIRQYLGIQKNAFYMVSKLRTVFRTKEQVVRDMITNVITQRQQATESLVNPTEFSFSFWTHLANAIIKEFLDKTNKLEREHTFCQAAYLIGFYAVQHKSERRKQKDTAAAYKVLDQKLRSDPYVFTVSDIAAFADEKGVPLTKRYTRNELHAFIEKKARPSEDGQLPELTRLRTSDAKEFYVSKDVVLPLTLKKIFDASAEFASYYADTFMKAIEASKKRPEMKSDQNFLTDLEKRLRSENQLLSSLLSYELLYLLLEEVKPKHEINVEISRILDTQNQKLIQADDLLGLSRKELLNQAKMRLPFWKTVPVLSKLFGFLGRAGGGKKVNKRAPVKKRPGVAAVAATSGGDKRFSNSAQGANGPSTKVLEGGGGSESTAAPKAKSGAEVLKKAMSKLKLEFVGTSSLDESMGSLVEKWNPLFDPEAKANLAEDVNSLIRDFLRKLKRSFLVKPPNAARIRTMAESLSENKAFEKIKRKDELMRYMELYMIKVLGVGGK